mmetsp:Transcript_36477/g.95829  ORF Transcript_36477/g.95829 Transcript_36477/m.95829 type:complete len:208 (+) Transcript_36477:524-1147(+)
MHRVGTQQAGSWWGSWKTAERWCFTDVVAATICPQSERPRRVGWPQCVRRFRCRGRHGFTWTWLLPRRASMPTSLIALPSISPRNSRSGHCKSAPPPCCLQSTSTLRRKDCRLGSLKMLSALWIFVRYFRPCTAASAARCKTGTGLVGAAQRRPTSPPLRRCANTENSACTRPFFRGKSKMNGFTRACWRLCRMLRGGPAAARGERL